MRVLHLGQRKTGSTWLQSGALAAQKAGVLRYTHRALLEASKDVEGKKIDPSQYDAIAAALPQDSALPDFASLETLITIDQAALAAAVHKVWPDVRILVTTRGPLGYLRSSFNNYALNGGTGTADGFARRFKRHMARSHDLDGIAAAWERELGPGRISFVPFELLRSSQVDYVASIETVLGMPIAAYLPNEPRHPSPPPRYLAMLREVNALLEDQAPDILKHKAWIRFVRTAVAGVAHSADVVLRDKNLAGDKPKPDKLPDLPDGLLQALAGRMTVLRSLPLYQPYLSLYGLAPEATAAK